MTAVPVHPKAKIFTLGHLPLLYIGVAAVLGPTAAVAHGSVHWSRGLTFAVLPATCTTSATWALREDLLAPSPRSAERRAGPAPIYPSASRKPWRQLG